MSDRPRRPGEPLSVWAASTGRIRESEVVAVRRQLERGVTTAEQVEELPPGPTAGELAKAREAEHRKSVQFAADVAPSTGRALWGRNPLVEAVRTKQPGRYTAALAKGPAPSLFASGDLPPFTACSIDPEVLLQVPWTVRHPLAAEPDRGAALALVERYSGPGGEVDAAVEYGGHPGNIAYETAVSAWLAGGDTDADLYASLFG